MTFSGNPICCLCQPKAIHTISWFQNTRVNIPGKETYSYMGIKRKMFLNNIDLKNLCDKCFRSNTVLIIETSASTLGVVLLTICIVMTHRYRWRLLYSIHKFMASASKKQQNETLKSPAKYDAFVSYCSYDRFWVHD